MRCRTAKSRLNRLLDRELSDRERDAVQRHVRACHPCREMLDRLRAADMALSKLPVAPDVPSGFVERVVVRAARRREQRPLVVPLWRFFSPAMRAAAAAVLMLGLGLGLGTMMGLDLTGNSPKTPVWAAADPNAVYGLDYLSDAPEGSLADAYMTLASTDNGGGR